MPIHDWNTVEAGIYHAFHHSWIAFLSAALNEGILPPDHYALPEQDVGGYVADVVALHGRSSAAPSSPPTATVMAVAPLASVVRQADPARTRKRRSHVAIKHVSGDETVAIIELVSPGNKDNRNGFLVFVQKACDVIERRVNLMVVDLFPPGPRDPNGVHAAIWGELAHDDFTPPPDKPLMVASYEADFPPRAYLEPRGVGDTLPDMPLFLEPGRHIRVPLEPTYQMTWNATPQRWRAVVLSG